MKIVGNLLQTIEGLEIYSIIATIIFFIGFIVVFIRTMRKPNKEMEEIKKSMLVDNDSEEYYTP